MKRLLITLWAKLTDWLVQLWRTVAMTDLTNRELAVKIEEVLNGFESFIGQELAWLTSTADEVTLEDPSTGNSITVQTYYKIVSDYTGAVQPSTGAAAEAQAWATHPHGVFVPYGDMVSYSALHHSIDAEAAQVSAESSAVAASTSADSAVYARADALAAVVSAKSWSDNALSSYESADAARVAAELASTLVVDGEQGIQGIQGEPGVDGDSGTNGLPGDQGANGLDGDQGIQGIQGNDGADGRSLTSVTTGAITFNSFAGLWNIPIADKGAFVAGVYIYCSDTFNSITGVVTAISDTQITVADSPDDNTGTPTSIAVGTTVSFSGRPGDDGADGSNGIAEAPEDGTPYVRQDGAWITLASAL